MNNLVKNNQTHNQQSFGAYGFNELVNGTSTASTDRFAVLQAEGDTVFSFENESDKGLLSSASYTLKDGKTRYGFFKNIIVSSGKLVVYYAIN